jgi:hypothetical protein
MNFSQKYFSAGLLALLTQAAFAAATAPSLGAAAAFEVLGGAAVTCTAGSVVAGDIGVSPGTAFTNTGCTVTGATPPGTNAAAALARTAFLNAYAALQQQSSGCTQKFGTLATESLAPGVYCLDAVAKTGTLTLTGPSSGVWIFLVAGALTGTDFSVVMAGGGQPCNVYWAPTAATTMTTSALKGNILAGNPIGGSITLTGGTVAGRILANQAVTMTGASVIGCGVLAGGGSGGGSNSCKGDDRDDDDGDRDHNKDKKGNKNPFGKDDDRDGKDGKKKK